MTVRLYEGDKTETGGAGIEITDNKVVNLLLRSLNNLIKINADDEAYVDLQLEDGIISSANMPVGVNVGRALQADGWLATGTLLVAKTASGDEIRFLFADDGKLYTDNGTGTFTQIYLKPEVDALFQQLRSELSTVAFSGDYDDLLNKPTLGTASALDAGNLAGNVPVLDSNGKLDSSIVPSTGVMTSYTVTNKSDLTTLSSAKKGDIGIVTSENKTYILSNDPYSTLSNWTELLFPTGSVSSVNGFTGAVNLTTGYIQESNNNLFVSPTEKATWNNKLGANNVSTVALTGNYGDLNNKPVIDSTLNTTSTNAIQNGAVATAINTINNSITTIQGDITDIQGDITTIQGNITDIQGDIGDIQGDITTIQGSITDIGTDKQDTLVSGVNIKTINNESLLGSGNIDISSVVTEGASLGTFLKAMKASGTAHWVNFPSGSDTTHTFTGLGYVKINYMYGHALSINGIEIFSENFSGGAYTTKHYLGPYTVGPGDVVRIWRPGTNGGISVTAYDYY